MPDHVLHQLKRPLIVISGPTASGKSDLAQSVALQLGGTIISADSMQIYRGMNIGTGKVPEDQRLVPHYGLDIVEPGSSYSAALFQDYARSIIEDKDSRDEPCILCGGTGFYIRAVIDDFSFPQGEQDENPIREKYERYLEEQGSGALWELLNRCDPDSAACVHPNNSKRVLRALELHEQGDSYARQANAFKDIASYYPVRFYALDWPKDKLNDRIDRRVDAMIEAGLVDEVSSLIQRGFTTALTAPQAIGYKEIVAYLDGRCSLDEAIEQIKTASHRYAKRQRTWLRRDKRVIWLHADSVDTDSLSRSICSGTVECNNSGKDSHED